MVAFKFLAIAFFSALTANAAPAGLLGEGGLVPLPPIDLPVTDIVEKVSKTFDGTPFEAVGETLNPDVSIGALDPAIGAVDVAVNGTGLLEGVNVAVKTGDTKRATDVDLGGAGISVRDLSDRDLIEELHRRAINVDLGGDGISV